jgi:hypothetical protein
MSGYETPKTKKGGKGAAAGPVTPEKLATWNKDACTDYLREHDPEFAIAKATHTQLRRRIASLEKLPIDEDGPLAGLLHAVALLQAQPHH